jgi:hypothetical protein
MVFHFRLLDYRDWVGRRPHRPRAERMMEMVEVRPSAMSVQTQKKSPLEWAILPPTSPAPLMDDKHAQPKDRPGEHDDVPRSPFPQQQRSVNPEDQDKHSTEA